MLISRLALQRGNSLSMDSLLEKILIYIFRVKGHVLIVEKGTSSMLSLVCPHVGNIRSPKGGPATRNSTTVCHGGNKICHMTFRLFSFWYGERPDLCRIRSGTGAPLPRARVTYFSGEKLYLKCFVFWDVNRYQDKIPPAIMATPSLEIGLFGCLRQHFALIMKFMPELQMENLKGHATRGFVPWQ